MKITVAIMSVMTMLLLTTSATAQDVVELTCEQNAQGLSGDAGTAIVASCPAGCTTGSVWGSAVYSDDSAVCVAAVHFGAVSAESGGEIVVVIQPGQTAYAPSANNGVTTSPWGEWNRSFSVAARHEGGDEVEADCGLAATSLTGEPGTTYSVTCPADCTAGSVWGTGVYSDDSAVCSAAIHAGVIPSGGGTFTLTVAAGQENYNASTQNGVSSSNWGAWGRSFTVAAE